MNFELKTGALRISLTSSTIILFRDLKPLERPFCVYQSNRRFSSLVSSVVSFVTASGSGSSYCSKA